MREETWTRREFVFWKLQNRHSGIPQKSGWACLYADIKACYDAPIRDFRFSWRAPAMIFPDG
jgi:hypothetical protein